MLNQHRQKIGAWLGMLAILLSMVAPTVSQVLRAAHDDVEHCAHHSHHHHPRAEVGADAHAGHHHHPDLSLVCDACPYCGLVAHSPSLPGIAVASRVAPLRRVFPPTLVIAAFHPHVVLTSAQPRAPPSCPDLR